MTTGTTTRIALTVNGKPVRADVAPRTHLADFLREQLLLTGTHIGCEHGICGACTVTIDGEIARACITYAVGCDGADVRTIEGYDDDPLMAKLRTAFSAAHALQCGYCTPGMLVAARDLVRRKGGEAPALSRDQIRTQMSGNLCRCTGYVGIVSAIESVLQQADAHGDGRAHAAPSAWLGPAPGPVHAHGTADGTRARLPTARSSPRARPDDARAHARVRASVRPAIPVTVGAVEERDGATTIAQGFVLQHPLDAVWQLMSDPHAVARCMPGLSLETTGSDPLAATTMQDGPASARGLTPTATPIPATPLKGRLEVKIGPITASFAGEGTVTQFAAEHRQVIEGRGGDRRSGSRVTGRVDYRLTPVADAGGADVSSRNSASAEYPGPRAPTRSPHAAQATRVDATMSYTLTGPLAQVGRSAIVRDLVARIGQAFAQNLDAQLADPDAALPAARLGGLSLLLSVLADRLRALFARRPGSR